MKARHLLLALALVTTFFNHPATATSTPSQNSIVAFGSCLYPWQPQPVWQGISALNPEIFLFLGDTVYTDKGPYANQPEPQRIGNAYRDLANNGAYQEFLHTAGENGTALYAVWDDHDYGINDGGGDYPHKLASKAYFLDFFGLAETVSGGADKPGIYQADIREVDGHRVQLLLLDTRSFRSPLKTSADRDVCRPTGNIANNDKNATVLGEAQWAWLEQELQKPADIRLLASSIQVIPEQHCFEKWANFPAERQRLFSLLKNTRANGTVIISGDRHLAEISLLDAEFIGYPLYEITASGLNSALGGTPFAASQPEPNQYRAFDNNILKDNFGTIEIVKTAAGSDLKLQLRDVSGQVLQETLVALSALAPPSPED